MKQEYRLPAVVLGAALSVAAIWIAVIPPLAQSMGGGRFVTGPSARSDVGEREFVPIVKQTRVESYSPSAPREVAQPGNPPRQADTPPAQGAEPPAGPTPEPGGSGGPLLPPVDVDIPDVLTDPEPAPDADPTGAPPPEPDPSAEDPKAGPVEPDQVGCLIDPVPSPRELLCR